MLRAVTNLFAISLCAITAFNIHAVPAYASGANYVGANQLLDGVQAETSKDLPQIIIKLSNNQCISGNDAFGVKDGAKTKGYLIGSNDDTTANALKYNVIYISESGAYKLQNKETGKFLTCGTTGEVTSGSPLYEWDELSGANSSQLWYVNYIGNERYTLTNAATYYHISSAEATSGSVDGIFSEASMDFYSADKSGVTIYTAQKDAKEDLVNYDEKTGDYGTTKEDRFNNLEPIEILLTRSIKDKDLIHNTFGNYTIIDQNYSGAIARETLSVRVDSQTKEYGDPDAMDIVTGMVYKAMQEGENDYKDTGRDKEGRFVDKSILHISGLKGEDTITLDEYVAPNEYNTDGNGGASYIPGIKQNGAISVLTNVGTVINRKMVGVNEFNYPVLKNYVVSLQDGNVTINPRTLTIEPTQEEIKKYHYDDNDKNGIYVYEKKDGLNEFNVKYEPFTVKVSGFDANFMAEHNISKDAPYVLIRGGDDLSKNEYLKDILQGTLTFKTPVDWSTDIKYKDGSKDFELSTEHTGGEDVYGSYTLTPTGISVIKKMVEGENVPAGTFSSNYTIDIQQMGIKIIEGTYKIHYSANNISDGSVRGSTPATNHIMNHIGKLSDNGFTREYKVTFNTNYSNEPSESTVGVNYTFIGWSSNKEFQSDNTNKNNSYDKATYVAGTKDEPVKSSKAIAPGSYVLNLFDMLSYDNDTSGDPYLKTINAAEGRPYFSGVTIGETGARKPFNNGDFVLYACWQKEGVTLPNTVRQGYKLVGWYDNPEGKGEPVGEPGDKYTPESDTKLYAKWELDSDIDGDITNITDGCEYNGSNTLHARDTAKIVITTYGEIDDVKLTMPGWDGEINITGTNIGSKSWSAGTLKKTVDPDNSDRHEYTAEFIIPIDVTIASEHANGEVKDWLGRYEVPVTVKFKDGHEEYITLNYIVIDDRDSEFHTVLRINE